MTTPPERKSVILLAYNFENRMMLSIMNVGDYVKVLSDFSPNKNRPARNGWIIALTRNTTNNMPTVSVEIFLDKRQYHSISITNVTIADMNEIFSSTNSNQITSTPRSIIRSNKNNTPIN